MRREDLLIALKRVRLALVDSRVHEAILGLNRPNTTDREGVPTLEAMRAAIEGYSKFSIAYERFGPNEKELLSEFGLDSLADSTSWVTRTKPNASELSLAGRIRQALETFPKFSNLLQRETGNAEIIVAGLDKRSPKSLPTKKVTFLIRETSAPSLTLKDLSSVISD